MKKIFKFSSEFQNLAKAEEILEEISKLIFLSEEIYGNLLLALSEAINNAIIHGNKLNKEKKVTVSFRIDGDMIEVKVCDKGKGFDPNKIPDPTLPDNLEKETGRGIFIIKSLSDKVEFENNGATIIMKFNLKKNDLFAQRES